MPGHVLRASQALLALQHERGFDKQIVFPANDGRRVPAYQCTKPEIEDRRIIRDIRRRMEAQVERPYRYADFMILSPHRQALTTLAGLLAAANIPSRMKTRVPIPDDLWSLLLVLRMLQGDDNLALRQWLPRLGLRPETIREIRHQAEQRHLALFAHARASDVVAIRDYLNWLDALREQGGNADRILETIASRVVAIGGEVLEAVRGRSRERGGRLSVRALVRLLYEEYGLLDPEEDSPEQDKVLLTTLHSAKGLEARVVYIIRLDNRFIPAPGRDPDEEVRVLYVGMTRAKETLELSFSERFDLQYRSYMRQEAASPLLRGVAAHLEFVRVRAEDVGR